VVFSPKSLLRLPAAASSVDDLVRGRFEEVLDDPRAPEEVRRIVLCSGKVHYDLAAARTGGVTLARVEQLYPFPRERIEQLLSRHPDAEVVWCQEEPQNRGAWSYIEPRLRALAGGREVRYAGRPPSASPAVGSLRRHRAEQAALVESALAAEGGKR
jgi:2-oxoglutarate dehydrogenase E1 component